jgi:hypothetical protein
MLAALDVDPDDQVHDLDRDRALVPDLDPQPVDVDDRVDLVDRPVSPDLDFVGDHVGDIRNQLPRRCHPVHLGEMSLDVTGRQPARIQRQNHLVDLPEPPRPFGTIFGSNVPLRSRGTSMVTGPCVVEIVFVELPLRELPEPTPAGSPRW